MQAASSGNLTGHEPAKDVKVEGSHIEEVNANQVKIPQSLEKLEDEYDEQIQSLTPKQRRRVQLKVDLRVTVMLGVLYLISLVDRNNLGFTYTAGMGVDLELTATQYSLIILMVYPFYVLAQPVTGILLRKMGPRSFFSYVSLFTIVLAQQLPLIAGYPYRNVSIVMLWGLCELFSGFVRDWYDLVPLRLLLGAFEAGVFPGAAYMLSCWYPRYELQKRNSLFYLVGTLATAFTGIVAYGIGQMGGLGSGPDWWSSRLESDSTEDGQTSGWADGISSWRWIFIIFGIVTCAIGIAAFFLVVEFPDKALTKKRFSLDFLTEKEIKYVVARIQKDRYDTELDEFSVRQYIKNCAHINVWAHAATFGLCTVTNNSVAYFLPIILREGMGFSLAEAQCLTAPPHILACVVMMVAGWLGDKYRIRSPIIIFNCVLQIIGLALVGFTKPIAVRFLGIFLLAPTGSTNIPTTLTWLSNNIRGQWKRALCSGLAVAAGGLGGIVGALVFRTEDRPYYVPGVLACIVANALNIVISLALVWKYRRANRKADAGGEAIEDLVGFRYTL